MASSLLDALGTDHVLSVAQLERHYGMSEAEARALGARVFIKSVSKTTNSIDERHRFIAPGRKHMHLDDASLRHLTGVAEMRQLLGAPHDAWVSDAAKRHARSVPDATWTTPEGVIAIEYDAGSYGPEQITDKLRSFKANYVGQRWGTPIMKRVAHLKKLAASTEPELVVFYAPWF